MKISVWLGLLATFVISTSALAVPDAETDIGFAVPDVVEAGLYKREDDGNSTEANTVKDAHLDCDGLDDICGVNCFTILCLGRPQTL